MTYVYADGPKVTNQMQIDNKIIKRVYPRTNNHTSLEFIAEKDPNLCLRLYSVKLVMGIEFPKDYTPDIAFPAKLFSDLKLEFNSQTVNSTTSQ